MYKTTKKTTAKKITTTAIIALLFCVVPGCVAPGALDTEIQGIRNDMGQLEKLVDQKADNTVVAEEIEQVNNSIAQTAQIAEELSLWRKSVQAETINYGGAGWVVVGTGVIALIFVGAGLLFIRAFMRRGSLLTLLTCAVQKVGKRSPEAIQAVKDQLKQEVAEGRFKEQDRKNLGNFAKKKGTFSVQKHGSEV